MPTLVPVQGDPFAETQPQPQPRLVPYQGDPFASAIAKPTNKAEFDALPVGSSYYAPSGEVHTKPAPQAPEAAPQESLLANMNPLLAGPAGLSIYAAKVLSANDPAAKLGGDIASLPQQANDAARRAGNTLTFGAADKADAITQSLLGGGDYATVLANQRAASDAADQRLGPSRYALDAAALMAGGAITKGLPIIGQSAATLGGRVMQGAGIGGVTGVLQGLGHDDSNNSAVQKVAAALPSGGWGALVGGSMPLVSAGVGKAYETLAPYLQKGVDGLSRKASGVLSNVVGADAGNPVPPWQAHPDTMLLDQGPSTRGVAQGVVLEPGDAKTKIINALTQRNDLRNTRLEGDLNQNFGAYQDPTTIKDTITALKSQTTSPIYQQALSGATPISPDGLMQDLTKSSEALTQSGRGAIAGVVSDVKDALGAKDPAVAAERLLNLRKELDAKIVYDPHALALMPSADKAMQGAWKMARGQVDEVLKGIPGIAEADASSQGFTLARNAVDLGFNSLDKGKTALAPETFAKALASMTPEEIAAAQVGQRGRLGNIVGTQVNDLAGLKSSVGLPGDWNYQKLGATFGAEPRDAFGNAVNREASFAQAYNDIVAGSQTAPRAAGRDMVKDQTFSGLPPVGQWPTAIINKVVNALMSSSGEVVRSEIADALTKKGAARDKLLEALMTAQSARAPAGDAIRGLGLNPFASSLLPVPSRPASQ